MFNFFDEIKEQFFNTETKQKLKDTAKYATEKLKKSVNNLKENAANEFDNLPGDSLNRKKLRHAMSKYQTIENIFNKNSNALAKTRIELNNLREISSNQAFKIVTNYINSLADSPQEFDDSYLNLGHELTIFNKNNGEYVNLNDLKDEATDEFINIISGGALTGIGIGALGPTAVTATVSAFGTASTGAAISSLSGAAATNATLAAIGGGSIVSGGGGIVGGKAILAWAGPIGWAVAGGCALKAGVDYAQKNKAYIAEINAKIAELEEENARINYHIGKITNILEQTKNYSTEILKLVVRLKNFAPQNYLYFNTYQKHELIALINNINSFSELLNQAV